MQILQAEGAFELLMGLVAKEVVGALTVERDAAAAALKAMIAKLHHSAAGGAPLLGIDGVCVICHGSSDERSIAGALAVAATCVRTKLNDEISEEIAALPALPGDE